MPVRSQTERVTERPACEPMENIDVCESGQPERDSFSLQTDTTGR